MVALGDLVADCERWIERSHGLLKNHGDLPPADFLHFPLALVQQIFPFEKYLAASDFAWRARNQAQNRQRSDSLATASLAYDAERFALLQRKGNVLNRIENAPFEAKTDRKILHLQQRRVHFSPFVLPRIENIPQTVTEEIETENNESDRESGKKSSHGLKLQKWGNFFEHQSPTRGRRRQSEAEKTQRRLGEDRVGKFKTETHQKRGKTVGENLKEKDMEVGFAAYASSFHVFSFFLREDSAAHDACIRRDGAEAESDVERGKAAAGRGHQRNGQEPSGKCHDGVHKAHDGGVDPTTRESRDGSQWNANDGSQKNRAAGDLKCRARAKHDPAVGITAQEIGAQPMVQAGRLETICDVDFVRVVGGQIGSEDRSQDSGTNDEKAKQSEAIAGDDPKGIDQPRQG